MVKGTLSKKQRDRKRLRRVEHFIKQNRSEEWFNFVQKANQGNDKLVDLETDNKAAKSILKRMDDPLNV